jgi:DNA polymerase elongation subunit (family B)
LNKLIFGKNNTEKIVNVSYDDGLVYLYTADGDKTNCEVIEHQAYALTHEDYEGSTKLKGYGYYKYITPILETPYEEVRGHGIYRPRSAEEGFMLRHGYSYYKGMKVNDVSLLSFDIEAVGFNPFADNAKVLIITNTFRDRNGNVSKKLFSIKDYDSDFKMIEAWCAWVRETDPDILMAHNGFGYDLRYLAARGDLKLGRDGSLVKFDTKFSKKRKDSQQQYEYHNAHCNGREIVDTMFMSITYDIGRKFPSYGLKRIEEHLGIAPEDRIEWDFKKYPTEEYLSWPKEVWEDFERYARDDADSLILMFDIMAPTLFYVNQSVPKKFQQMVNEATGSQIDSFMIRAYLQDGLALPMSSGAADFEGAISMGIPGVYDNVRKVDVASLYPSIMRQYEIYPKSKDYKKYFLQTIDYFTEERLKNKKIAKDTGDKYYDSLQNAQKIFINSCYGFMGAKYLLFNDPEGAAEVTRHGREILQKGVEWATGHRLEHVVKKVVNKGKPNEKKEYEWILGPKISTGRGYDLVNVDTDSFSITNGAAPTEQEFAQEIDELNKLYPSLIRWEDDNVYQRVVVVKAKNYVMKLHPTWGEPKVIYKGSSIKDQKKEPILRKMMDEIFEVLLNG